MTNRSFFDYPIGATPLDKNESEGLIPSIALQSELNEFERNNILNAYSWAMKSRKLKKDLLSISGLLLLHRRMFDNVWSWAGTFRKSEKNLGCDPRFIDQKIHQLCENTSVLLNKNPTDLQRIAVEFHYHLVAIHPFSNGNGRHARLAADLLLYYNGQKMLSWGEGCEDQALIRKKYLDALKAADKGDLEQIFQFALLKI